MADYIVPLIEREAIGGRRGYERMEMVYIPIHMFRIKFQAKTGVVGETMAGVDGLVGEFAFLRENGLRYAETPTGEIFKATIGKQTAQDVVSDHFRWRWIQMGLRRRRPMKLEEILYENIGYYPFWVGYYKKRNRIRFHCWDAVSGKEGGIKTKRALLVAFLNRHQEENGK